MSDRAAMPSEAALLRQQITELSLQLGDAQQALAALAGGQVDAVARGASATPDPLAAAREELRTGRRLLRAIFDGALDALLLDDDQGVHVDVNAAACELFGLTRAELLGRRLVDFASEAPRPMGDQASGSARRPLHGQFVLDRPDGTRRLLDYYAVSDVAPGLHLVALRDTTEQVAAQEALRRSEARFRAMIEKSQEGISLLSRDARTLYQSPAVVRLLGYEGNVVGPMSLPDLVDEEERPKLQEAVLSLLEAPSATVVFEFRIAHPGGGRRWLELSATNLLHDPDVGALVANFRDITERKRFEAELRETEQRYRRLIEELPQPVLVHVDHAITFANAASARALGLESPDLLIGRSLAEFATADTRARIVQHTVGTGHDPSLELGQQSFVRASDGLEVHAEVKSIPFVYDGRAATLSITSDVTRRVEAERATSAALREADLGRRKLEAVLAALPVGVWIADEVGALTQSNPAATRIWGGQAPHAQSPAEYGIYQAFWPDSDEHLKPEEWGLARTFANGETVIAEPVTIQRFDGTRGHVLNSTAPILDESGRTVGGVVVMLDVTLAHDTALERERLIASLEFERRRLGMLLAKAPAFIAVLRGKDHVFELVNDAYMGLIGQREPLGRPVVEVLPELRGQGFVELMDNVLATGEPYIANDTAVLLSRTRGAAPERRYVDFVYQPVIESDGTISGVFLHGVDVTTATLAKQRVYAQFHGVPVPTYVWQRVEHEGSSGFVLADFNQAALTFSDGAVATHLGEAANTYFADAPESVQDLELCLEQGHTHAREQDFKIRKTGETRRLYVSYSPAPPDLVIVHAADITDRIKMEQQLRQAQKMEAVGLLAGGIAHDFNNLLSVILSYADLSIEDLRAGDPLRKDLEQIQQAGRRATDLTRQLLAFSRQQVLAPRVIAVDRIIASMMPMLRRLLGEDVLLTLVPAPSVGLVLADPGQIEQVVMNLAVNARDAMPQGGKLTIEISNVRVDGEMLSKPQSVAPGPFVVFAVSDSGTGMDAATLTRIFEPFFTTREVGKGTGLGLSTVFGIVHQSGGFITVYSEPAHGTTFKIFLPRTDRASDEPLLTVPAPASRRGSETILLVEDEEMVRGVACAILRRNGYRVIETSNGGEAYLAAQDLSEKIDLLLTDVVMPRMSGRKLAEQLAITRPDMKVLFASGYTDDVVIRHGVLEEGVAFLQKPFTADSLLSKVRDVLDDRRPPLTGSLPLIAPPDSTGSD